LEKQYNIYKERYIQIAKGEGKGRRKWPLVRKAGLCTFKNLQISLNVSLANKADLW